MNNTIKYFLYARKSSEDKNRQINSIEDQTKEIIRLAKNMNLDIVETFTESRSAKKPGRVEFNKMLKKIQKGEAQGILCWKLDRLARNPVDGGQISWMLQNGIIQHIQTHSGDYKPSDNVLMMQVELGMANQYIKDLNTNVSRGTRLKAERGWNPSPILPIGYKHNPLYIARESKIEIVPNKKTFPIVNKLWKLLLTGAYSVKSLKREADKMGLVNPKGKKYALNTFHLMFKKPFYAGYFYWKDANGEQEEHKGLHKKMVKYDEFIKAQKILGNKYSRPTRKRTYSFIYRSFISCGDCGGYVTAEYIHQIICTHCKFKYSIKTSTICKKCKTDYLDMNQPSEIIKRYYRCSRKKDKNCTQRSVEEKQIESYILNILKSISISSDFYSWSIEHLKKLSANQDKENSIIPQLLKDREKLDNTLNGIIKMRADNEIDSEKYASLYNDIKNELKTISESIRANTIVAIDWKIHAEKKFEFALKAYEKFKNGTEKIKKQMIFELGYNLTLKDKLVSMITSKTLLYIKECELKYSKEKSRVQPKNHVDKYSDFNDFTLLNPILLADNEFK